MKLVLVVDDEEPVTEVAGLILEEAGYEVATACSGREACDLHRELRPDIIVMDVVMPDVNGLDALAAIRAVDGLTPVIIMTGHLTGEYETGVLARGADSFMPKPFRRQDLLSTVGRLVGGDPRRVTARRQSQMVSALAAENQELKGRIRQLGEAQARRGPDSGPVGSQASRYRLMCGAAAHGLKGEFMHIGDSVRAIRASCAGIPEAQEECEVIERSVAHSQVTLRRLLDYLEVSRPVAEPVDVAQVARETEELIRPRLPSKVTLRVSTGRPGAPSVALADREQLLMVLLELTHNAAEALRADSGAIGIRVIGKPDRVDVTVADNGPGIPKEIRRRLLKEQVPSRRGTGLGLLLCSRAASAMGGEMHIRSGKRSGTTVALSLPSPGTGEEAPNAGTDPGR